MNFIKPFVPAMFHTDIKDLKVLKRDLEESPWTTMCVVVIPQCAKLLFVNTTRSILNFVASFWKLNKNITFSYFSHAMSCGRLALAYTITLLPNFMAFKGLSLIETCKKSEAYWHLKIVLHHLQKTSDLLKELDETGSLSMQSIQAYILNHPPECDPDPNAQFYCDQMASYAIELLPPDEPLQPEKQDPLIGTSVIYQDSSQEAPIEQVFSVIHEDFTGNPFIPPHTTGLVRYILDYIDKIKEGKIEFLKESPPELETLISRLQTILTLEEARKTSEGKIETFASAVIKELKEKKVISLPSGYAHSPSDHRIYITLTLEEDQISGRVIDFGEGAKETSTLNTNNSVRIFPEQILKKASITEVQNSYFWKVFLDLLTPIDGTNNTTPFSPEDFNKTLLSEWPGGIGAYQGKDKKPEHLETSQFIPLRYIIHQILGDEDYKPFMMGLYLTSFEEYLTTYSLTADNLFAVEAVYAHVARMFEKLKDQKKINQGLETFVNTLDTIKERINAFKQKQRQLTGFVPWVECKAPFYARGDSSIDLSIPDDLSPPSNDSMFNQPQGDLKARLNYCFSRGRLAFSYNQRDLELCWYRKGLEEIPPIGHPIWEERIEEPTHHLLISLVDSFRKCAPLCDKKNKDQYPSKIGPDDAALIFKVYYILFDLAAKELDRPDIAQFFLGRMKIFFQDPNSLHLLRPTRPDIMADFATTVNAFLKAPALEISAEENEKFRRIRVGNLTDFHAYPHFQYIYEVLQKNLDLKDIIDQGIRTRGLGEMHYRWIGGDPDGYRPNSTITEGHRIAYLFGSFFTYPFPELSSLGKMMLVWGNFFSLFGTWHSLEEETRFTKCDDTYNVCYESFYLPGKTNLFIKTYPELMGCQLTPALKKELPFNLEEKDDENEHLLISKSLMIGNEKISQYEVKELLGITNQRVLSIHLLVDYFDHHFYRLKLTSMQSLFQAFLNEVFFDEAGKMHHLLTDAAQNDPIQLQYLTSFFQRKRKASIKIEAYDDALSFLFWMEGVVLSHWISVSPEDARHAYTTFKKTTADLFQKKQGSKEIRHKISIHLVSLLPYFEKTAAYNDFKHLVLDYVPQIPESSNLPLQTKRRCDHGILTGQNPNWKLHRNRAIRIFNGKAYAEEVCAHFSSKNFKEKVRLRFFQLRNKKEGVLYKKGEKVPYCYYANEKVILLEGEKQTNLILSNGLNQDSFSNHLERLSDSTNIFAWKNKQTNQLTRIDYFDLNLSFHFEEEPNETGYDPFFDSNPPKIGSWMSSLHPGYFIDPNPVAQPFEPFSHYIVLRNKEGKRLVYILNAPFEKVAEEKSFSLLFYPLDQNGEIDFTHLGHEEILYGLYLAMRKKNYNTVKIYLKTWGQERLLHSEKTVKVLDYFYQMEDKSPWTVIIRIKLSLSLLHDPLYLLPKEDQEKFTNYLIQDMMLYNGQRNNTFPFFLSKDEQKKLATYVPTLIRAFYDRKIVEAVTRLGHMFSQHQPSYNNQAFDLSQSAAKKECPATQNSLRPKNLTSHFLSYYQIAKSSETKNREALAFLLRSCEMDPSEEVQLARIILQNVLKYPYYFPSVNAIIKLKEGGKTNEDILSQLYQTAQGSHFISQLPKLIAPTLKVIYSFLTIYQDEITLFALSFFAEKLFESLLSKTLNLAFPSLFYSRWFQIITSYPRYLACQTFLNFLESCFLQQKQMLSDLTSRIWTLRSKTRLLEPETYQAEFTPEISLSQMGPLIDVNSEENTFIMKGKYNYAEDLGTLNEMEEVFQIKAKNPCIQRERNRFLKGIETKRIELEDKNGSIQYRVDPTQIVPLIQHINIQANHLTFHYQEKEKKIFAIAHQFKSSLKVQVHGDLITPLSLNELIIAFGRKEHAKILKSNPSLTKIQLRHLEEAIGEYLLYKIAFDRAQKGLKLLQKAQNEMEENQDRLLSQALDILSAERKFDPSQNPHLLVFEYFMELTLRENQVQFLNDLIQGKGDLQELKNILQEAHTGFGKSKVAIPLWLFLTSQSGRLTLITTPEPLLEEMRIHLKKVLGQTFDQQIIRLDFDRTRLNDLNYLKYLNGLLNDAKKEGKCIALSINALHGLAVLKRKEAYLKALENNLPSGYFQELDQIRELLDSASNFVDEASECFYSRYSFDYSVGRKKPVDQDYVHPIRELYERLLDDVMRQDFHFDFLPVDGRKKQEYITPEVYKNKIRPHLIEKVIAWFKIPENFKGAARANLSGEKHIDSQAFFNSMRQTKREEFAIVQSFLVSHLEQGLTYRWNERYRLGNDRIAYPARNGKLIPRSQFSSIDLIIAFTLQANLKAPFEYHHIEEFINHLIEEEMTQSSQKFKASTPYQLFAKMFQGGNLPQNLHELGEKEKRILLDRLNQSIELRLLFTEEYVLPKLTFFPQKIVSSPQLVCNRIGHTQGASGTMHENVPESFEVRFEDKTIFNNLLPLWKHSQDALKSIPKLEGPPLIDYLLKNCGEFNVIIDVAGYLRGFPSNEAIAREILENTPKTIEAVGFIDEAGKSMILTRGLSAPVLRSNASIDLDTIFMFYSQEAVVGFDIELPAHAKALVTAGRETRRNLFMQGVGRLRGLQSGMHASFVTIEEELKKIRSILNLPEDHPVRFKDLFFYVFDLESEKQGEEAFTVIYNECLAEIEEIFWKQELKMSEKMRLEQFKKIKNLQCKETFVHPVHFLGRFLTTVKIDQAIDQAVEALLAPIEKAIATSPELSQDYNVTKIEQSFRNRFNQCKERFLLEHRGKRETSDLELTFSEVEQEQESETELDLEREVNLDRDQSLYFSPAKPVPLESYWDLTQYKRVSTFHPEHKQFISDNLLCTNNFFNIAVNDPDIHKKTMKPAHFFLVIQNKEESTYRIVLLDLYDAGSMYEQMKKNPNPQSDSYNYYFIGTNDLTCIASNGEDPWSLKIQEDPKFREVLLESRPYTGMFSLDESELKTLEENETKSTFLQSVKERFEGVWPHYPRQVEKYHANSILKCDNPHPQVGNQI